MGKWLWRGYFKKDLFPLSVYLRLPVTQPSSYFYQRYQNITLSYSNRLRALTEEYARSDALPHLLPSPIPVQRAGEILVFNQRLYFSSCTGTLQVNTIFLRVDTNLSKRILPNPAPKFPSHYRNTPLTLISTPLWVLLLSHQVSSGFAVYLTCAEQKVLAKLPASPKGTGGCINGEGQCSSSEECEWRTARRPVPS